MAAGPQRAGSTPSSDHYNRRSTITELLDISIYWLGQRAPDDTRRQ